MNAPATFPSAPIVVTSPERRLDPLLMKARGGFAWWYLDLVGPDGDGVVLIWSFGLPFLPGYLGGARRGEAPKAGARPSLNVAVYQGGEEVMYLLQEYPEADAHWDEDRFVFGDSTVRSQVEGGRRLVDVALDCPIPGSDTRLTGTVSFDGVARMGGGPTQLPLHEHDWTPLAGPGRGRASLRAGDWSAEIEGRGYHDRNGSRTHLDGLGIEHWVWGRVPLEDRELVYYLLYPRRGAPTFHAMEIDANGQTRRVDGLTVELGRSERTRWGMPYWPTVTLRQHGHLWATVRHSNLVDDGPFYLRFQTTVEVAGETAHGSGELIRPGRIDRAVVRSMVRMKVHQVGEANSHVLPFLTGPKPSRVWRYLRQAVPSRAALPARLQELRGG
ncbi:MAG: hypothetical protein AB8I08_07970 [Sandaracinaceae bacterium]